MTFILVLLLCLAVVGVAVAFFIYKRRDCGCVRPVFRIRKKTRRDGRPAALNAVIPKDEQMLPTGQIVSDCNAEHLFERDGWLCYSSDVHRYTYRDVPLTYVDEAVEACFPAFRSVELSQMEALRTGESVVRIRERWEAESEEALKLGRFLHRQIENLLHRRPVQYTFHYSYVGKEYAVSRATSMSCEMNQFVRFLHDFPALQAYRTAWVVFDEDALLAGVVDCLATDADGRFVLVDWKRSRTFGQENEGDFVLAEGNGHAVPEALSAVRDTPFGRETVHLNLLRLILVRRYHLRVDRLQVLLLHAGNASYHLLDVPMMEAATEAVLKQMSDRDAV